MKASWILIGSIVAAASIAMLSAYGGERIAIGDPFLRVSPFHDPITDDSIQDRAAALELPDEPPEPSSSRASRIPASPADAGLESASTVVAVSLLVVDAVPSLCAATAQQSREQEWLELEHRRASAARRAERTARALDLSLGETLQLADCYSGITAHRRASLAVLRQPRVDHETMKQAVQNLRTWQQEEMERELGHELGRRINAFEDSLDPEPDSRRRGGVALEQLPARSIDQAP